MLPRPRFRLPIWAAVALVAAIYVARSILRGWNFAPDLPVDAIVLGLFVVLLIMVAYARHVLGREDQDPHPDEDDEDLPAPR